MEMQRVNLTALAVAFVAGLLVLRDSQNILACLAGLALLMLLLAFGKDSNRTGFESLAFAMVCGLAVVDMCAFPLSKTVGSYAALNQPDILPPLVWLVGTAILWFVDRSNVDNGGPQPVSFSSPTAAPVPLVMKPAPLPQAPEAAEITRASVSAPPPPAPSTGSTPAAAPVPVRGKPAEIYVNMMNQGMKVLRSVHAEHLGRDFYMIADEMPADENWEFVPGQVVRCKKQNLSNGKGLVAFEEAPRT